MSRGKKLVLDDWQERALKCKGHIAIRSGRQTGKSTVVSIKAAEYAVNNPKKTVLIISATERQANLLFEKVLGYLVDNYSWKIKKGREAPTKHIINITNGTRIYCLPTGLSGYGIRGYTVDVLIADEAAFINDDVWQAVSPMLATTRGQIILLSTPFGRSGYFYRCFNDDHFTTFHVSSEDCERIDKHFLEQERERMSKIQYAQEYLGEFVDELQRFFPTELIEKCMVDEVPLISKRNSDNFLGVDVAQLGGDETVLFAVTRVNNDKIFQIDLDITDHTRLTETIARIKLMDKKHNFKKIYIDTGGLGVGVFDPLLEDEQTRRKVEAINNSARPLNYEETRRTKNLKEDLYVNLRNLMEKGKICIKRDHKTHLSLSSVQYEYSDGKFKIFGRYTHICEALIRAAWSTKDKTLNLWCR